MDLRKIKKLIDLLEESNLAEIEIKEGEESVRLSRAPVAGYAAPVAAPVYAAPAAPAPQAMPMQSPTEASTGGSAKPGPALPEGHVLRSPMVGTCYLAAEPGAANFVSVGDTVKQGDTLLIVEAMKVMNPIQAPRGGKVTQLLVANAQPVEFDQPLVVIE